jgi:hypothetical protein
MSQGKEAILFPHPEIVSRVILMVMGVDHDIGMKSITDFQEFILTVNEACIDQQSIDKKSVNFEKGNAQESADHP